MKAYARVEVWLQPFVAQTLDRNGQPHVKTILTLGKQPTGKPLVIYRTGGWVGPRAGLGILLPPLIEPGFFG
jgi:hypothetical protein